MYLYGASGHAKVIIDILRANNEPIEALFDDNEKIHTLFDYPVLRSSLIIVIVQNSYPILGCIIASTACVLVINRISVSIADIVILKYHSLSILDRL